jgi:hypothetical protein
MTADARALAAAQDQLDAAHYKYRLPWRLAGARAQWLRRSYGMMAREPPTTGRRARTTSA